MVIEGGRSPKSLSLEVHHPSVFLCVVLDSFAKLSLSQNASNLPLLLIETPRRRLKITGAEVDQAQSQLDDQKFGHANLNGLY